jgi:hypothetical protein
VSLKLEELGCKEQSHPAAILLAGKEQSLNPAGSSNHQQQFDIAQVYLAGKEQSQNPSSSSNHQQQFDREIKGPMSLRMTFFTFLKM